MNLKLPLLIATMFVITNGAAQNKTKKALAFCESQATKTLKEIPSDGKLPRRILTNETKWQTVDYKDWTSGFWPGILWYCYEASGKETFKTEAEKFSNYLKPLSQTKANDHDLGFQVFNSFGNGYRLTKHPEYKTIILRTADSLAKLYNPNVGTLLSWPNNNYGGHNTIIDNMMNLELLFWASKNGGEKKLYDIALQHAETTMQNHFRPDYSSYHVVVYDPKTGKKIKGVTAQGYSDDSLWARGQAWAIYGFTMVYRETKEPKFLEFAHKIARVYLDRLPADLIPYWDFNAPGIADQSRDASAAAIVASALAELSEFTTDQKLKQEYFERAQQMVSELSNHYQDHKGSAFLLHATGHKPAGSEIDCSIIYADYYYLETLLRLKKIDGK